MKKAILSLLMPLSFFTAILMPRGAAAAVGGIHASAQINAVFTNSIYRYTITLNNTGAAGDASINTFWYAWVDDPANYLPSSPTNIMSPGAWSASVTHGGAGDGYAIQWTHMVGVAIAPGKHAEFSFDLTNAPAEVTGNSVFYTNTPVGTSVVYSGGPFVGASLQFVVGNSTNLVPLYTVSNLNDSGIGSLRQALLNANTNKGASALISFATNGTITLGAALPPVSKPVTIDGSTAPGFGSNPVVSVNFAGKPGLLFSTQILH